jgi:hypothetical protein
MKGRQKHYYGMSEVGFEGDRSWRGLMRDVTFITGEADRRLWPPKFLRQCRLSKQLKGGWREGDYVIYFVKLYLE